MDQKSETVKLNLNTQIESIRTEMGVSKIHLRQEKFIEQETRIPVRPQTPSARQDVSIRSALESLQAKVLYRRTLLDIATSPREQPSRPLSIMPSVCGPSPGDDTSSDTSPEHPPATIVPIIIHIVAALVIHVPRTSRYSLSMKIKRTTLI